MDKPIFYTRMQAATKLNLKLREVDGLIAEGKLASFKHGNKRLISDKQIDEYINKKSILYIKI